ncbi:MAG: hypothetical protein MZU91_11800 [Desulfosudis oleivorans]|nr:hypothetical protein [Desulfosudis oleivorans]
MRSDLIRSATWTPGAPQADLFEASIHENWRKLDEIHPGLGFKTSHIPSERLIPE